MDIIIKKITKNYLKDNLNYFINIINNVDGEYWSEQNFLIDLPGKYTISLMALNKDTLIGYIIASKKENDAYIHKFMIKEEYRCKGIGSTLLNEFQKVINTVDLYSISLSVYLENIIGLNFYKERKFRVMSERLDNKGKKLIVMRKEIR